MECKEEGCTRPARARGWCGGHWERWRNGRPLEGPFRERRTSCIIDGCQQPHVARGWCKDHYQRWSRHGDPNKQVYRLRGSPAPTCSVDECERDGSHGKGLCKLHYERQRKTGDVGPAQPKIAAKGSGHWYENQGYLRRSIYVDGKIVRTVLQHVQVMEQQLGRRLVPPENVHHKNGIGTDNAPGNLELWLKMQPSGQRVTDLMEYIAEYHADAMAELLARGKDPVA
jgi:hypothetical protein